MSQWCLDFDIVRGDIDLRDHRFCPRFGWNCRCLEGFTIFVIRRRGRILSGWDRTSMLPQRISDQPVGLELPHPAGRYRLEGSPFLSPVCWNYSFREGFWIRVWYCILPGWCWLHERHPVSDQPMVLGFSTLWGGGFNHGDLFSSPYCLSCR